MDIRQNITRGRWDIYGPVHKGLRLAHGKMSQRLGAAEWSGNDQGELIAELRNHLRLASNHLKHEDEHIHPALAACDPQAEAELNEQHDHHQARFAVLAGQIATVEAARPQERDEVGRALYHSFNLLVSEDFAHMHHEETVVWPRLCTLFSDAELQAMEMAIIASIPPADTIAFMSFMIPAMTRSERVGLLGGMKAGAPHEAYAAVMELAARPTLSADDWAHLEARGLAA